MSLIVDRKRFWNLYRAEFGDSPQLTVDGLNFFLDRFEVENRLKGIPQFAYVLSTAYHESGKNRMVNGEKVFVRFQPVKETRERSDSPRRANQDRYWNTGFYGRGFPQTTWKRNYLASGEALGLGDKFVKNPDLLLEPQYAYDAMIICMARGIYTGKSLSNYISDTGKDYEQARRVVNGQDRALLLAKYARAFEQILRDSKTNSTPAPAIAKPTDSPINGINETAAQSEGQAPNGQTIKAEITSEGAVSIEKTEGAPAPKERIAVVQTKPQKWSSRIAAKITGMVSGNVLFQWIWAQIEKIQGLSVPDAVWVIVSVTIAIGSLLWIVYEIISTWRTNKYQETIDSLLVKENSTPDNLVQLIPADEIELYRMRGFKIITRGEKA